MTLNPAARNSKKAAQNHEGRKWIPIKQRNKIRCTCI